MKYYYKYNHLYVCGDRLCDGLGFPEDFVTYLHAYEVGTFKPIEKSLIILCEAGTYFNNRLFATMPHYTLDFFALHGHYQCDIVWESQTANVDCQLLDKTNRLFICTKSLLPCFTHTVQVIHKIHVNPETGKLDEIYVLPEGFIKLSIALVTGKLLWCFRPRWYGVFDTHADICFKGKELLDYVIVQKQCPQRMLKLLNYYQSRVNYEKTSKNQVL